MKRVLLVAFALLAFTAPAWSATVVYNSRAAFDTAVGGPLPTIDFEGIAPANSYVQFVPPTTVIGGLTFSHSFDVGYNGYLIVVDDEYPNSVTPLYNFGTGASMQAGSRSYSGPNSFLQVTFPSPINAFAVDVFAVAASPTPLATIVSIGLANGDVQTLTTLASYNTRFIGLVTAPPISWVRFSANDPGAFVDIDNVSHGIAAIPEPSTLSLTLLGAATTIARLRRRRAARAAGR